MKNGLISILVSLTILPLGAYAFGLGGLSLAQKYYFFAANASSHGYSEKVKGVPKNDLCFSKYITIDGSTDSKTISGEITVDKGFVNLMWLSGGAKFDDPKWCDFIAKNYTKLKGKDRQITKVKAVFDMKTGKKITSK